MGKKTLTQTFAAALVAAVIIAVIVAAFLLTVPYTAPTVPSLDDASEAAQATVSETEPLEDGQVAAGYQPSGTEISDIATARNAPSGNYYLTQDITVTSLDVTNYSHAFSGTLDGNGHTVYIDAESTDTSSSDAGGLFIGLAGGTVKNLTVVVRNFRFGSSASGGSGINAGIIAGYATGGSVVDNVYIRLDADKSSNSDVYAYSTGSAITRLGALFGKAESGATQISDTTVYNSAAGTYGFSAYSGGSLFVGGFVGAVFTSGTVNASDIVLDGDSDARITAIGTSSNLALVGGIVGYNDDGPFNIDGLILKYDMSMGSGGNATTIGTSGSSHVGYILGQADSGNAGSWSGIYSSDNNGREWLDGNDQSRGAATYYDKDVLTDARFASDGTVAFAVDKRAPGDAANIVRTIQQGTAAAETVTVASLIARSASEVGQPAWIVLNEVNASAHQNISFTYSSNANYGISGGETLASADGGAYYATRTYNGITAQAPQLTMGSERISGAWTEAGAAADVGTHTLTYSESAVTSAGFAAIDYEGTKYFVKNGVVYQPGQITVGDGRQTLAVDNDIVVEITKLPITLGIDLAGITYLDGADTVRDNTSVTVSPQQIYGSITGFELSVTTADGDYSASVPAGTQVTVALTAATVSSGNGNYDITFEEASVFEVAKMTIDGAIVLPDMTYDGGEKTATFNMTSGSLAEGDRIDISYSDGDRVNVTDSDVTATAVLPDGNYAFADTATAEGTIRIVPKTVVMTASENGGKIYDGQTVDPSSLVVAPVGIDDMPLRITATVEGGKTILNADDYVVIAALADGQPNYTAQELRIEYVIDKKVVTAPAQPDTQNFVFNGIEQTFVVAAGADYTVSGNTQTYAGNYTAVAALDDPANMQWSDTSDSADKQYPWSIEVLRGRLVQVATNKNVQYGDSYQWTASDFFEAEMFNSDEAEVVMLFYGDEIGEDGADDLSGIAFADAGTVYHAKMYSALKTANGEIIDDPRISDSIEMELDESVVSLSVTVTVVPGQIEVSAEDAQSAYNGEKVSEQALAAMFTPAEDCGGLLVSVNGAPYDSAQIINAGSYEISVEAGNSNYELIGETTATYTVNKADPTVNAVTSFDGTLYTSDSLYDVAITVSEGDTSGTVAWDADQILTAGNNEYTWTFTPDDATNYNGTTGSSILEVEQVALDRIDVSGEYRTEYTAFEDFDKTGMTVTAVYNDGSEKDVTESALVTDGEGLVVADAYVTVSYAEGGVSVTAQASVTVSAKKIDVPTAAEDLTYDGTEKTGVTATADYTVRGNVATEAGIHHATASLTDKENTVWSDTEDTEDKTVEWSIAKAAVTSVTVNVTVPEGGLFTSHDMPEITVLSVEPQLTGSVSWDVGQALVAGVRPYNWTFTPDDDNYETYSGKYSLTAIQAELDRIEVSGEYRTEYTAFEDFDRTGMIVTAYYSDGASKVVHNYTVEGGSALTADKTYVTVEFTDGEMTETASVPITVSKAEPNVDPTVSFDGTLYTSDSLYDVTISLGDGDTAGTISWDADQLLTAGNNEYTWTFVPTDEDNYETATGSEILEVEQVTLERITVSGEYRTEYTAFEDFDKTGMIVTAVYNDGSEKDVTKSALVTGGEGLVVADAYVTVSYAENGATEETSVSITVSKAKIAVPEPAEQSFTYNGEEQTFVIAASDDYTVGGNTATDAGDYTATVTLKDTVNTEWADGTSEAKTFAWSIAEALPEPGDDHSELFGKITAMQSVTWENAESFVGIAAEYEDISDDEIPTEVAEKFAQLQAQYEALRAGATSDIEGAQQVAAKTAGRAVAGAAAAVAAVMAAVAVAKRRTI